MKAFPIFALVVGSFLGVLTNKAHAEWHSWDTPPKVGEKYMSVVYNPGLHFTQRQTLIISHYSGHLAEWDNENSGWFDVNPESVWNWINEGSKVFWLPNDIRDLQYLSDLILLQAQK